MKRIPACILTALLLLPMAGCSDGGSSVGAGRDKPLVIATIFPAYDVAREVAGGHADAQMLLPPGAESHTYEPTPQDIIRIRECDVFVYTGGESDQWVETLIGDTATTTGNTRFVKMVDTVTTEGAEAEDDYGHEHSDGEHGHGVDEHVWTSPRNVMHIAQQIRIAMAQADPAHQAEYEQNYTAYCNKLQTLDSDLQALVKGAKRKTLVFGDRFPFYYFAQDYGLDYIAAFPNCTAEAEPDTATVAAIIDKVKREQIPVVFHIEFSNEKIADTICAETGAKKLQLHSCHNVSQQEIDGGATYLGLMQGNLDSLKEALY